MKNPTSHSNTHLSTGEVSLGSPSALWCMRAKLAASRGSSHIGRAPSICHRHWDQSFGSDVDLVMELPEVRDGKLAAVLPQNFALAKDLPFHNITAINGCQYNIRKV